MPQVAERAVVPLSDAELARYAALPEATGLGTVACELQVLRAAARKARKALGIFFPDRDLLAELDALLPAAERAREREE